MEVPSKGFPVRLRMHRPVFVLVHGLTQETHLKRNQMFTCTSYKDDNINVLARENMNKVNNIYEMHCKCSFFLHTL